jgi:hypothetical protein
MQHIADLDLATAMSMLDMDTQLASRAPAEALASIRLQVFDMQGRMLIDHMNAGETLATSLDAAKERLANGAYLYAVTLTGSHGTVYRSQVKKLIVLR